MKTACVILAAGLGTRMNSNQPKVLHPVCGIPMLESVIRAARELRPAKVIVVAGRQLRPMREAVGSERVTFARQTRAMGTAHALKCARPSLQGFRGTVLVLNGDAPLVTADTLRQFVVKHRRAGDSLSVLSFIAEDPSSYGRIIRDARGGVVAVIEEKDADAEQKRIKEVNSGVYALHHSTLGLLDGIRKNRVKGEYYLTDIVAAAQRKALRAAAYCMGNEEEFIGVNTREELFRAGEILRKRIVRRWLGRGVSFYDTATVFIHPDATIGEGTTIYPNVWIEGTTRIGVGCTVYPNVRISSSDIGDEALIKDSTVIEESVVGNGASVGPFAHVRPGSIIGPDTRIGNFVELKKATIGRNTKASHLSYLGDSIIGSDVNIGAGTITCNYDGKHKHTTVIENGVFVGSDTQLVAPVRVGRGAYIGAGSTITKDVPPDSLALSRTVQRHLLNWAKKRKKAGGKAGVRKKATGGKGRGK